MKQPKPTTIDFETFGIEGRPAYPPMPIGVSIKPWGRKARYYAFGHATRNNATWDEAVAAVAEAYRCPDGVLCQNAKFDLDVAETWFGLAPPPWDKVHDTMFLLFLDDPHQQQLSLKPASERLLDWPPEERDAVGEWLVQHQPVPGVKISLSPSSPHYFMGYLPHAPGDLVGTYANGDVDRTAALFKLLWPKTRDRDMLEAYDRERRLMPCLLEMERRGLPVDLKRLRADVKDYGGWLAKLDAWLLKILKADADLNLDSGAQLMNALLAAGYVDEAEVPLTPTGKYQTNKDALTLCLHDLRIKAVLAYRAQLKTCLNTFMVPWLKTAERSGGLIYTSWNQVRAPKGRDTAGTRTGRLSSTPNFQNIPNEFKPLFAHEQKGLPRAPFNGLPPLPRVRSYVVPFKGEVFIDRDYSQQEPRILAHFDGGSLMQKYLADPWIDFHDYAKAELEKVGKFYERKPVKNTNLGLIYGMGVPSLAERNAMSVEEAGDLKRAVLNLYPGLKEMYADMKTRAAQHLPIRTWGGREYYCEEPKIIKGRIRQFDYKLVNVLIQGSAADCTKEAIIRFCDLVRARGKRWRLVLNVHDQLTASVPRREVRAAMEAMRETMESVEFDVPILSEGAISETNWDALRDYDKKGVLVK